MSVLVGTSGWQYRDGRDTFYPPDVPRRRWLEYDASRFATVENNGTGEQSRGVIPGRSVLIFDLVPVRERG